MTEKLKQELEHKVNALKKLYNTVYFLERYEDVLKDYYISVNEYSRTIDIVVYTLDDLKEIKRKLKAKFCMSTVFTIGKVAHAIFYSREYPNLHLIFKSNIDNFPEELMGKNCRFEKVNTEEYKYVCERRN